jgi:hypothetical protein
VRWTGFVGRGIKKNRGGGLMILRPCLVALAVILLTGVAQAIAAECPVKSNQMEDIIAALNGATDCDSAMKLFEACEYGTSGDTQFGAAVEKKCEAAFLTQLKPGAKRTYQRELAACDRKYRNKPGTMNISFTAFCRAEVAQRHSHQGRNVR